MTTRQEPRPARKREPKPALARTISEPRNGSQDSRLYLIGVKVDAALRREIAAYAEAHGVSRSRAAGHYPATARETIHEREGVPAGRADEPMEEVDGLRAAVDILGSRVGAGVAPFSSSGHFTHE